MNDIFLDGRFDLIEKYKNKLIEGTNIENSPDEMHALDSIMFRFWQMGWLDKLEMSVSQPDNSGDLISRHAAIDALEEQLDYLQVLNKDENPTAESEWYGVNWARNTIADLPSAQPERKTGHWERHNIYYGDDVSGYIDPEWRCSECGGQANVNALCMYDLTDFCPHCGADMRGEQDE
jgi:hypothetical protein